MKPDKFEIFIELIKREAQVNNPDKNISFLQLYSIISWVETIYDKWEDEKTLKENVHKHFQPLNDNPNFGRWIKTKESFPGLYIPIKHKPLQI